MDPFQLETRDATITGGRSRGETPLLAIHGVTSNHRAFTFLERELPQRELIAPDLRGRGGSIGHDGHAGMIAHADDMVRVLDHFGIEKTPVVGHSMGGFVSLVLAHRHPDRVWKVVLVDGGLPLGAPDFSQQGSIDDVMAPIAARLATTFDSRDDAMAAWRAHPAFADGWSEEIEDYAEYDLQPGRAQSRVSTDAVRGDTEDLSIGSALRDAIADLRHPVTWMVAPRGLMNETPGLYPPAAVDYWRRELPDITVVPVPDVNHYTVVMSQPGAAAVAAAVQERPAQ